MQADPCLPPVLHELQQACEAFNSWVRPFYTPDYVLFLRLLTGARRRRNRGPAAGSGMPAGQPAAAAGSGSSCFTAGHQSGADAATDLEPVEDSLSRALGGAEVLDLEPEQVPLPHLPRLVLQRGECMQNFAHPPADQLAHYAAQLVRIGGLLAEAAAAAGASVHMLESLEGFIASHVACVTPDSVRVLMVDANSTESV